MNKYAFTALSHLVFQENQHKKHKHLPSKHSNFWRSETPKCWWQVVPHEKLWRKATRILCKVKDDLPSPFGVFSRFCRSQLTSLWMYSSVLHQRLQRWQRKYEKQIFSGRGYKERNNMKICRMAVRQVPPDSEIESCRLFARPCLALIEPDNQPWRHRRQPTVACEHCRDSGRKLVSYCCVNIHIHI